MQTVLNTIANMSRNTTENNNEAGYYDRSKAFLCDSTFQGKKSLNGNSTIEVGSHCIGYPKVSLIYTSIQYAIARRIFMAHFDQE